MMALTVNLVSLDHKDCQGTTVLMERLALLVQMDSTGTMEKWEGLAVKGRKVAMDLVVKLVRMESQDQRGLVALKENRAHLAQVLRAVLD